MAEEPEVIREQIEQIRERVGKTMDALSYKANVKERAKDKLGMKDEMSHKKGSVVSTIRRGTDQAAGTVKGGRGQAAGAVKNGPKGTHSLARGNPRLMALGAVAAGVLVGVAIPSSDKENRKLGQSADQVEGEGESRRDRPVTKR